MITSKQPSAREGIERQKRPWSRRFPLALVTFVLLVAAVLFLVAIHILRPGRNRAAPVLSPALAPGLSVYHADFRQTSEYDPGSARVFLRVASGVRIERVLLDDLPIPVWGLTEHLT